jgi:hypothetical protein
MAGFGADRTQVIWFWVFFCNITAQRSRAIGSSMHWFLQNDLQVA